jgi:hypothetical protein
MLRLTDEHSMLHRESCQRESGQGWTSTAKHPGDGLAVMNILFVTQSAQYGNSVVTDRGQYCKCSRCPGEVPPSPWCLTGSG